MPIRSVAGRLPKLQPTMNISGNGFGVAIVNVFDGEMERVFVMLKVPFCASGNRRLQPEASDAAPMLAN